MASLIPGFPGSAVALLGLVCFGALTDFSILTEEALVLATVFAALGSLGQVAGPALSSRAFGGASGAATGAALGASIGSLVPIPGMLWVGGLLGAALFGITLTRHSVITWLRGVIGAAGGCVVSAGIDFVAVLAQAAILAIADFRALG
jgi:uncharacterized protein YqgC (DUF456 family)